MPAPAVHAGRPRGGTGGRAIDPSPAVLRPAMLRLRTTTDRALTPSQFALAGMVSFVRRVMSAPPNRTPWSVRSSGHDGGSWQSTWAFRSARTCAERLVRRAAGLQIGPHSHCTRDPGTRDPGTRDPGTIDRGTIDRGADDRENSGIGLFLHRKFRRSLNGPATGPQPSVVHSADRRAISRRRCCRSVLRRLRARPPLDFASEIAISRSR